MALVRVVACGVAGVLAATGAVLWVGGVIPPLAVGVLTFVLGYVFLPRNKRG